uniref:Septin 12 n=1 Tax=Sphenodon punctatus TaxID=8508 RepID=A0A8D0H0C1_SPHPU
MEEQPAQEQKQQDAAKPGPGGQELFGYVGIEAVLDQIRIKTIKTGIEFNIMVVGQSGLGKSTMVNTLFKSKVSRKPLSYEDRIPKTVQLRSVTHAIEEKGVKMKLTVTDTPGFGDQINNENCWEPIIKYINEQYEHYLREEILINRKRRIPDTRIHGCVYFVPPTGHWLRPLDLEFMRRLSKIVNVVPVIAKADTLTLEERAEFKQRIKKDLKAHGIIVYPQEDFDEDPDDRLLNDKIREKIPFAVVGADKEHQVNGKKVLGRKTKWGIVEGHTCRISRISPTMLTMRVTARGALTRATWWARVAQSGCRSAPSMESRRATSEPRAARPLPTLLPSNCLPCPLLGGEGVEGSLLRAVLGLASKSPLRSLLRTPAVWPVSHCNYFLQCCIQKQKTHGPGCASHLLPASCLSHSPVTLHCAIRPSGLLHLPVLGSSPHTATPEFGLQDMNRGREGTDLLLSASSSFPEV